MKAPGREGKHFGGGGVIYRKYLQKKVEKGEKRDLKRGL
jgi:hypothetical protein